MKRKTKDGKIILREMARWNSKTHQDEMCVHYLVLPEQRRFLYRVINQLQPLPLASMDANERNLFQKVAQIIGDDEYTTDDIPLLDVARMWFTEYMKSPRTNMTTSGHELRQFKVGKWYTNPKYNDFQFCKIKSITVRTDTPLTNTDHISHRSTFYNSIKFDEIINNNNEHDYKTYTQSNPDYDYEMREVEDSFIESIINKT